MLILVTTLVLVDENMLFLFQSLSCFRYNNYTCKQWTYFFTYYVKCKTNIQVSCK